MGRISKRIKQSRSVSLSGGLATQKKKLQCFKEIKTSFSNIVEIQERLAPSKFISSNVKVKSRQIERFESENKGMGLRAVARIKKGQIMEYAGEIFRGVEVKKLLRRKGGT